MGKYLDDAKAMYNYARIELQQWQDSNDEILLRDAAEKTWGAVTLATNDLLESYGRHAPSGTGSAQKRTNALERRDRRVQTIADASPVLVNGSQLAQRLLLRRGLPVASNSRHYRGRQGVPRRCRDLSESAVA